MATFGGYDMPLWYPSGAKQEHLAVLTSAGFFDTSHMAVVAVSGHHALELLQHCFTRNLNACVGKNKTPLTVGKCAYGIFLNEQGTVIDDAIIMQCAPDEYLVVVNAGMGAVIADHLRIHNQQYMATILDMTDKVGKIDIQGKQSAHILKQVLNNPSATLTDMTYFTFKGNFEGDTRETQVHLINGTPVLLSRTGYTGEFGFEIFMMADQLVAVWELLLDAGKKNGLIACGLASRDSLRAGAVLPLSHQDIGAWCFANNPWEFALPYNEAKTNFTKRFIGDDAIENIKTPEYTHAFVGYDLRKVSAHESPAQVLDDNDNPIGIVLSCVSDMGIGRDNDKIYSIASLDKPVDFTPKGLCCGFVKVRKRLSTGKVVTLKDATRQIKVVITDDIRPARTARTPMREML